MAVEAGTDIDSSDFNFKSIGNTKIADPYSTYPPARLSLIAISNKFGFTFIGVPTTPSSSASVRGFSTNALLHRESSEDAAAEPVAVLKPSVDAASVTHVSISCDDLTLAVVFLFGENHKCLFFDLRALGKISVEGDNSELYWFSELLICSGAETHLLDLRWNPASPLTLACVTSDGKLTVAKIGKSLTEFAGVEIVGARNADAVCCCWSPKGKQVQCNTPRLGFLSQET